MKKRKIGSKRKSKKTKIIIGVITVVIFVIITLYLIFDTAKDFFITK